MILISPGPSLWTRLWKALKLHCAKKAYQNHKWFRQEYVRNIHEYVFPVQECFDRRINCGLPLVSRVLSGFQDWKKATKVKRGQGREVCEAQPLLRKHFLPLGHSAKPSICQKRRAEWEEDLFIALNWTDREKRREDKNRSIIGVSKSTRRNSAVRSFQGTF